MFESLTEKFLQTLRHLSGKPKITDEVLDEVCRELRTHLLEADVNVKVVKDFVQSVREKARGKEVHRSLTPEQQFIKIVYQELTTVMGGERAPLNFRVRPPAVFIMAGLQGSGKTTSTVKLARHLKDKEKKNVMAASLDIYRPAAIEQLSILMQKEHLDVFQSSVTKSVKERALLAKEDAIRKNVDVILFDTAGRLHLDKEMMEELENLCSTYQPAEVFLVLDAMTGQDAVNIAVSFQESSPLTGVILSKLDGDARGGAALSVRAVTGVPVKFVGTGEKASDFEPFFPDRLASRLLDLGDLLSLSEKASETIDKEDALAITKKARKNALTLADFYSQLQQIKKMGSFENLLKFLPGAGQISKQMKTMAPPEEEFKKIEAIILSMTKKERVDHDLIDGSRRKRIAKGSGTEVQDVNKLLKQFLEARKMMTRLAKTPLGKQKWL